MKVTFKGWESKVIIGAYSNGRKAIQLFDATTGEPIAKATVNVPDYKLDDDQVIIKDYSENAGIYETLRQAGVIGPVTEVIPISSYGNAYVCELLFKEN